MRLAVHIEDLREFELKPSTLLSTYLQLAEQDVKAYFLKRAKLVDCACPACLSTAREKAFLKFSMQYWQCLKCQSLYTAPRPQEAAIDQYYATAKSRRFWEEEFSQATEAKRREKVFKPRVEWIGAMTEEFLPSASRFFSVNTIHRPFIDELVTGRLFQKVTVLNPKIRLEQAAYPEEKVEILRKPLSDASLANQADAVSLFEVVDRLAEVETFFRSLHSLLTAGGLCFLTTVASSGFDQQVLWEKSRSLFPPDRINAFSIEGLMMLFERHGLECLELSTPGLLDIEVVANAYKEDTSIPLPRFVKYMLDQRDASAWQSFQEFLQMNRLSSSARAVLRKK